MKLLFLAAVLLLIGLMLGLKLAERTQKLNAYPNGTMALLAHHHNALREGTRQPACAIASSAFHLTQLSVISDNVGPAFVYEPSGQTEFLKLSDQLKESIEAAIRQPASDCKQLEAQILSIDAQCRLCHQRYH